MNTRKITIRRSEVKWYWYIIPVLWTLFGLFYASTGVATILNGDWGLGIFQVFVGAIDLGVAYIWYVLGLWSTWAKKYTNAIDEDVEYAQVHADRGEFNKALNVLNRTETYSLPSNRFFKFDKSLISK